MFENIKSKKIFNIIFEKLTLRKKANILKYNKKLLNVLNITKKIFQDFQILKQMDERFNLNIKDIDSKIISIINANIGNEILEIFNKIEFNQLKELYLSQNLISDITPFEKIELKNLEVLWLDANNISDIDILEKVNFKELKKLYLFKNKISDITVLEKVNFEKLEELNLKENEIDIKINNEIILKMESILII